VASNIVLAEDALSEIVLAKVVSTKVVSAKSVSSREASTDDFSAKSVPASAAAVSARSFSRAFFSRASRLRTSLFFLPRRPLPPCLAVWRCVHRRLPRLLQGRESALPQMLAFRSMRPPPVGRVAAGDRPASRRGVGLGLRSWVLAQCRLSESKRRTIIAACNFNGLGTKGGRASGKNCPVWANPAAPRWSWLREIPTFRSAPRIGSYDCPA
jgi:hypothetical protein